MDFMKPIAIVITSILARGVIDALMRIPPFGQTAIDVVLVVVDQAAERTWPDFTSDLVSRLVGH